MLPIIFVVPVVQLLILVNAANLEIKNISTTICDKDMTPASRMVTEKFIYSPFFKVENMRLNDAEVAEDLDNDRAKMAIIIPHGFARALVKEKKAEIQILFNAINGTVAGIGSAYAQQIIFRVNNEMVLQWVGSTGKNFNAKTIKTIPAFWYNPDMNYKVFMVPAILVILVTIIGMMLAAMNIVREKEMGTIEQINVTPIKKVQFIVGKLLPFWFIALLMLAFGLTVGKLLFNIPIVGNLGWLFMVAGVYLIVMQGVGLMISNTASTQQQAMFIVFFIMIVFIMMGGIFTPTYSMPVWAQYVNFFNPVAHFMKLIRMILIKGSAPIHFYRTLLLLIGFAVSVMTVAVVQYRKRT